MSERARAAAVAAAELYAADRKALAALVAALPERDLERRVPACPDWRVRDVVAHVTGACTDVLAGRVDAAISPAWTATHVDARRHRPIADVLDEWAAAAPELERRMPEFGRAAAQMISTDVATHRLDVLGALGRVPDCDGGDGLDTRSVRHAADGFAWLANRRVAEAGLPPLRLEGGWWQYGEPADGAVTVTAPAVELVRGLAGRRSERQLRAWNWSADPNPYLPLLSPFGPPAAADVHEWDAVP